MIETANLSHPGGGALRKFRVVLSLPRSGGFAQNGALAAELDLALGYLGEERTPAALADKFVDVGNYFNRQNDMCSSG